MAVGMSLNQRNDRRIEEIISLAVETWIQVGDYARAARAAMWAADIFFVDKASAASKLLLTVSAKDEGIQAALLLEQAAYSFLFAKPKSSVRKFAFHCIMAASLYQKASMPIEAIRCFFRASQVYDEKGWWYAEDHARLAVARLSVRIGNIRQAIQNFIPLVASGRHPLQRQRQLMKEFQDLIIQFEKFEEIFFLEVPKFEQNNVEVIFNDRHTLPSSAASNVWLNGKQKKSTLLHDD